VNGFGQTVEDSLGVKKPPVVEKQPTPPRARPVFNPSVRKKADSISVPGKKPKIYKVHKANYTEVIRQNPYYNFFARPINQSVSNHEQNNKDGLFYAFVALILYFALIRLLFSRYMNNLFALFFRASLKQKQIREQLLQTPLPSLLLNILFVICGGIYIAFLFKYYNFSPGTGLVILSFYATGALTVMYLCKFTVLKFLGWIFNISEATDMYIFIVFLVNKMLAIFLIPLLVLMAFSSEEALRILVSFSFIFVIIAFAYRYIIAFAPVRKQINVSQFHFFLYLCGFEIIPLLVIYKVLLSFFERSF
jgi:hypothetical protein